MSRATGPTSDSFVLGACLTPLSHRFPRLLSRRAMINSEREETVVPNRTDPADQAVMSGPLSRATGLLLTLVTLGALLLSGCTFFRNQPPVPGASVSPATGRAPLVVTFDASPSYDPDGIIVDYTWWFDDGQSVTGESPEHTFVGAGQHTVTLAVTDDHGQLSQTELTVEVDPPNTPPVARISATPNPASVGQDVEFSASASTDDRGIIGCRWSFGDGSEGQGTSASHRYQLAGDYTVTLVVTDEDGATSSATTTLSVQGEAEAQDGAVVARISASAASLALGEAVTFDGTASTSATGRVVHYVWTFGDGDSTEGSIVTHRYLAPGQFTVRLIVADASGSVASRETEILVTQPTDDGQDPPSTEHGETASYGYSWWFDGRRSSVSLSIPVSLIEEYSSRSRCVAVYGTYDRYVLDPLDDPLMAELAALLTASVDSTAYYDIADNALAFVQSVVAYAPDPSGVEYPRYPVETLVERIGDCEDSSILYASLLRTLGHGAVIAGVDTSGSGVANHMVVFVPVGDDFAARLTRQGFESGGLWVIEGRIYALAETAVDGSTLPLGVDPWGLEEGDIHQVWDVARLIMAPQVSRYEPPS